MDLQSSINSYGKVLAEADKARIAEEAKELELRKNDIYSANCAEADDREAPG